MGYSKTYSFEDVQITIRDLAGGGSFSISEGGIANEGITIETNDRVTTLYGADGEWMHSLHCARGGRVTMRVMRTGIVNSFLSKLFTFDTESSANTGQILITIMDVQRGDHWTITGAAIVKLPTNTYGTEGGTIEWVFACGTIDGEFGTGSPAQALG
jgi:hypothetical protein